MAQYIRGKAGLVQHFRENKERAEMRIALTGTKVKDRERLRLEADLYEFIASWLENVTLLSEEEYDRVFQKG
jgi:hypothetical protein